MQVRNNQNRLENSQKLKKNQLGSGEDIFVKIFGTMHEFGSIESQSQCSSLGLGIFDEVLVSKF